MGQYIRNAIWVFLIVFIVVAASLAGSGHATTTFQFAPTSDTYVSESSPTQNYGTKTSFYADGSPNVMSMIRFNVTGLNGSSVTKATLSIYALSSNKGGVSLGLYNNEDWTESGITYNTLDSVAVGSAFVTTSPTTSGQWVNFDVTAQIANEGPYTFMLLPTNSTNTKFASREAGTATAPKLVIETDAAAPSVPPAPAPAPSPAPGSDPVIAAAGDIACDPASSNFNAGHGTGSSCRQEYTANDLAGAQTVLALGDNQYYCGGLAAFQQSYDLSWGRYKSITRPAVGNHEYLTSGGTGCDSSNINGAGYFTYFGAAAGEQGKGYYSFDVGSWHLIALNTNCSSAGGCSSTSPQGKWLASDLATHPNTCTLAYWHIPLWSSGGRANNNSASMMQQLYNANVDVVLTGHDHIYERFAPQNAAGVADPARGIRAFVVGTGGSNHTSIPSVAANSEVRSSGTFGVIKMTLRPTSYDWSFQPSVVPGNGTFSDSGTSNCH